MSAYGLLQFGFHNVVGSIKQNKTKSLNHCTMYSQVKNERLVTILWQIQRGSTVLFEAFLVQVI